MFLDAPNLNKKRTHNWFYSTDHKAEQPILTGNGVQEGQRVPSGERQA